MSTLYVDNLQPNLGSRVMAAGHVVQVVQSTSTTQISTTSTSPVDTGFSASITPTSASSKILVSFFCRLYINAHSSEITPAIYRNGSTYIQGGFTVFNGPSGDRIAAPYYTSILDSPASSSTVTYNLYLNVTGDTGIINPNGGSDGIYGFILQEIAQ